MKQPHRYTRHARKGPCGASVSASCLTGAWTGHGAAMTPAPGRSSAAP